MLLYIRNLFFPAVLGFGTRDSVWLWGKRRGVALGLGFWCLTAANAVIHYYPLFCWANAHYRQPNSLSEDLVPYRVQRLSSCTPRVTTPTAAHTSAPVAASTGRVVGPQTAHPRGHIPCSALRGLGRGLGPGGSWQARLVPFRLVSTGYQP